MTTRDYGYPILNELNVLLNQLNENDPSHKHLMGEARLVLRLGETAHGNRHRTVLAPKLIEQIKLQLS